MNLFSLKSNRGFTLIELTLAMSFISVLLIVIAMTIIQVGNIYNRGLMLKNTDQIGRSIISEFKRGFSLNSSFNLTDNYLSQDDGGRLCVGQYSYIWNYGKAISEDNFVNKYSNDHSEVPISLIKVLDPASGYCKDVTQSVNYDGAVELINVGQYNLAIQSFSISSSERLSDAKTGQSIYNIEFIIGTNNQDALLNSLTCKTPGEAGADTTYCSTTRFNILVRAGSLAE